MTRALGSLFALVFLLIASAGCGGGGGGDGSEDPAVPTRTPNDNASVCGGSITSAPKLCGLEVVDAGVRNGVQFVRQRLCISDREGDLGAICVAVSVNGVSGGPDCDTLPDIGTTVNECIETDPIPIAPLGVVDVYAIAVNVGDRDGNVSNTVATSFSCCF